MATTKKKEQLVSRVGFTAPGGRHVKPGELVNADDPVVKKRGDLFMSTQEYVEAATANPGELRINKKPEETKPEDHQSQKASERAVAEAAKED